MADGTRPKKSHTLLLSTVRFFSVPSSSFVLIVAFPLIILRPRPRTKRSKYSESGGLKRRASRPVYRIETTSAKAPNSHWAESSHGSKCRRTPLFNFGSDAAHDVKVQTMVPSNPSCRARKHLLAVEGSRVLSGTLTCEEDRVLMLRCVLRHPIQRVVQGSIVRHHS